LETLIIIIAFWLILMGVYGVVTLRPQGATGRAGRAPAGAASTNMFRRPPVEERKPMAARSTAPRRAETAPTANVNGLFSEVDMLRAQIEHLRTEVLALSAVQQEKPKTTRRSRGGPETELSKPLRRQVREARDRRPVHA
jgi:hypothetical protein